jgi:tetratricopeptide (TPR) repeat protein
MTTGRVLLLAVGCLGAVCMTPLGALGQTSTERAERLVAADSTRYELRWQAAREYSRAFMLEPDREERLRLAHRALDHARAAASLDSLGIEGRYRMAVAYGQLADVEEGRTRVRVTKASWDEAGWVLAVDSLHAGAHHIRGRINAGVQRVSPIVRLLARLLLGADAIAQTSWEGAIHHLEKAAQLEPGTPMHHFDLAQVYRDRDRPDDMRPALEAAAAASGSAHPELDEEYRARAREMLGSGPR